MHLEHEDQGFTLIELLIAIAILGIIATPMANVIIDYLHNTNATIGRLVESHDAQLSTSYFQQDVASIGVHDYTLITTPTTQSVEVNVAAGSGLYPCGTAEPALVRMAWDDFTGGPSTSPVHVAVAYVLETVPGQTQQTLHRVVCSGSTAVSSDTVLAHDVVSATATCSTACTAATPLPNSISLSLTIHDANSGSAPSYSVVLSGQRRQT